jgi:hypothetical protein
MVLVKMFLKIGPPTMRGSLVMSMASISPSRREVSPAESLRWRAKLLLPRFRLETAVLRPESLLYNFLGQMSLYRRRGLEARCGPHKASGRAQGARPVALWATGGSPLVFLFSNIFYIFNKKIREILGHLEIRRIGIFVVAISGPEFQLPVFSLFI